MPLQSCPPNSGGKAANWRPLSKVLCGRRYGREWTVLRKIDSLKKLVGYIGGIRGEQPNRLARAESDIIDILIQEVDPPHSGVLVMSRMLIDLQLVAGYGPGENCELHHRKLGLCPPMCSRPSTRESRRGTHPRQHRTVSNFA